MSEVIFRFDINTQIKSYPCVGENDGFMLIISNLVHACELTENCPNGIYLVIIQFANAIGVHNHSLRKQINAMIKWSNSWAQYQHAKIQVLNRYQRETNKLWMCCGQKMKIKTIYDEKGVILKCSSSSKQCSEKILINKLTKKEIFGQPQEIERCGNKECGCLFFEKVTDKICVCSHSNKCHTKHKVFPDEWDGQQSRPNKLSDEQIEELKKLPIGWVEYHSANGIPYYYNSSTGETTWTQPMNT